MKRDFEKEFKELKLSEVPDLWGRIEAALAEKANLADAQVVANASKGAVTHAYADTYFDRAKSIKPAAFRKWGTLAAACLCIAVIVPALSIVIGNLGGRKSGYSDFAPNSVDSSLNGGMNTAADERITDGSQSMSDSLNMTEASETPMDADDMTGTSEIMADAYDMTGTSGMPADADDVTYLSETAEANSMAAETDREAASTPMSDSTNMTQESQNMRETEKQMEDKSDSRQSAVYDAIKEDELNAGMEDGDILDGVVVEIEKSYASGENIVYKAVVKQADADGMLQENDKIDIVGGSGTEYESAQAKGQGRGLKAGSSYEVSLRCEKNDVEVRFVLIKVK